MTHKPEEIASCRLVLDGFCIETSANRRVRELTRALIEQDDAPPEWLDELELLQDFVVRSDFRRMRAERPELEGKQPVTVDVIRDDTGYTVIRRDTTQND